MKNKQIATMVLLNHEGGVDKVSYVEYHSRDWELKVEMGWITHTVDLLPC